MTQQNSGDVNIQTYMIVWDVNVKIINKAYKVDIFIPLFRLTSTETKKKNWIRIETYDDVISIQSNLSSIKDFKRCTTFMINPVNNKILDVFKGFEKFTWKSNGWSEKMQFVFELGMQCDSSAVQPIIWKRFTTELKPPISTNDILLNLDSETSNHTVLNKQGVSCIVERYTTNTNEHNITVIPENPTKNWNLLTTVIVRSVENNMLDRYYFHTNSSSWKGRCFVEFKCFVIFEINEMSISQKNMSKLDISAITSVIMAHLIPANAKKEKQQLNTSSSLLESFNKSMFCDVTVHVQEQQIRAHKIVLATSSTVWHDLFVKNETLAELQIVDFDYETIKELIEYMYSGVIKQATDELLIAADKYGVDGLKKFCEEQLIHNIDMKSVVNLLVIADRCKALVLYDKVIEFIVENLNAFNELEEAKAMFMIYPELTFKLLAQIS